MCANIGTVFMLPKFTTIVRDLDMSFSMLGNIIEANIIALKEFT